MNIFSFINRDKQILVTIIIGLFTLAIQSFLFFHIAAEGITIFIALLFLFKINRTASNGNNHFLLFLCYASLSVGVIDFFHIISYSGMGVPIVDSANKSTQLWLAGRFILSSSFLIAPFFLIHGCPKIFIVTAFTLVSAFVLSAVFYFQALPECLAADGGLTVFKIYGEYAIIITFVLAMVHFTRKKRLINWYSYTGIEAALCVFVFSEISFTLYPGVFSTVNILGHILKVLGYGFIYYGLVVNDPYTQSQDLLEL